MHPITGMNSISANAADTLHINGVDQTRSDQLLKVLYDQIANETFIYAHQWKDNDFVMWDNKGKINNYTYLNCFYKLILC
jgi:alpha-ketoglutarate-dependent taurine dioxygenase